MDGCGIYYFARLWTISRISGECRRISPEPLQGQMRLFYRGRPDSVATRDETKATERGTMTSLRPRITERNCGWDFAGQPVNLPSAHPMRL